MSTEKKQSKSLNKIHRRKNQQIQKQFECVEEGCRKAYGSYAALYTHMKNKHAESKLPQMKPNFGKNKTGKKGRPQAKEVQPLKQEQSTDSVQCKICNKSNCLCVDEYDSEQKNKTIQILKSEDFVTFVTYIGNLAIDDKFTWVRNTEQDFEFYSQSEIKRMIEQFNKVNKSQIRFSQKIVEILSFSSKFWDKALLNELYQSFFVMRLKKGKKQILEAFGKNISLFSHIIDCADLKKQQFEQICNLIKFI